MRASWGAMSFNVTSIAPTHLPRPQPLVSILYGMFWKQIELVEGRSWSHLRISIQSCHLEVLQWWIRGRPAENTLSSFDVSKLWRIIYRWWKSYSQFNPSVQKYITARALIGDVRGCSCTCSQSLAKLWLGPKHTNVQRQSLHIFTNERYVKRVKHLHWFHIDVWGAEKITRMVFMNRIFVHVEPLCHGVHELLLLHIPPFLPYLLSFSFNQRSCLWGCYMITIPTCWYNIFFFAAPIGIAEP